MSIIGSFAFPWPKISKRTAVRIILGLAALLLLAGFLILQSCQTASTANTTAKLNANQTEAAIANGADAVASVGGVGGRAAESDRITQENSDDIRSAQGADAAVPDDVHAAGLRALCRRAAYRGRAECLQFAPAQ